MTLWADGTGEGSAAISSTADDGSTVDDDEEYEEAEGGNRLLGFMFGNVDNSGDLDVDYLDEDAKEHLAALADKLGPSLTDIDLSGKSPQTPSEADQDYEQKAENAVDYEDFNEAYEGPEVLATEEDFLLPKKDFFSKEVSLSSLGNTTSVFDDENYDDEDDDLENQNMEGERNVDPQRFSPSGEQDHSHEMISQEESLPDDLNLIKKENSDILDSDEDDSDSSEESTGADMSSLLPVLYVEDDGKTILRFSEIFGVHEPLKKGGKRDSRYLMPRDKYKSMDASEMVEEDEEEYMKAPCQDCSWMRHFNRKSDVSTSGFESDSVKSGTVLKSGNMSMEADNNRKDSYVSDEPMKDALWVSKFMEKNLLFSPKLYPLDQEDWEDRIIWNNSPSSTDNVVESCELSGPDSDAPVDKERDLKADEAHSIEPEEIHSEPHDKSDTSFMNNCSLLVEPFGSNQYSEPTDLTISGSRSHPQLLRLESQLDNYIANSGGTKDVATEAKVCTDAIRRFSQLNLQNRDIVEGSWLDNIVWEPDQSIAKPKLIYDLEDQQMLFELWDMEDAKHSQLHHAGAMIVARSLHPRSGHSTEPHNHEVLTAEQFNISNDKFYSNRKSSQQLRSNSKKRTGHVLKILHSIPALKLQTMKAKLSNKDVANFHQPKALWYPRDIEVPLKEQWRLAMQGPIKIIMKSLGGKGSKLHVDAEETVASVKAKASKKLDFKLSEPVKIIYSGRELEDNISLAEQNVRANSVLHLIRTKIHFLSRAQKLPGENKSRRPPGAFKKKSDLSVKDGHVFLMEYCEERPLLLGNPGMGARLCTYYQKSSPGDQTGNLLRNGNNGLGIVVNLDPADKSPFLGDIKPSSRQSCLETNMYRAPIFQHKVSSTDYLLVRSSKGKLSIRRIDRIDVVGQQEPLMEVMAPGSKGVQSYVMNRLLVYMYREFRAAEKRGSRPFIRVDELSSLFPMSYALVRKRLKNCADLQRGPDGNIVWVMKRNFRIPSEEELRRMVTPENVCAYESMQAGQCRLKRLGITRLFLPAGLSSAMNQLPDEAIALAAASHIERELQITPWNLSNNFVSCTNQDRANIERLEITGVGDPSGRGLGFSYVRSTPKAPIPNSVVKKKTVVGKGSTVTGTDADLRRLSMEAARELLLKFNVPDEQIAKLTRWHRIALIRKLSSEQAASGLKVDSTAVSKFARGQRMSFLQLQQQAREKCQEIWERQIQSLCSGDRDENESETEANSDLDSFAGDLENLLDAEEGEEGEEDADESKQDNVDGVRGLKMRRRPFQTQAEEEIEDEAAEAAELCKMLMDDEEADRKKKKKAKGVEQVGPAFKSKLGAENGDRIKKNNAFVSRVMQPEEGSPFVLTERVTHDQKGDKFSPKKPLLGKLKAKKKNETEQQGLLNKKVKILAEGMSVIKEKKSARESFVCGACGQLGHMRTNKNCPKYGEDPETRAENTDLERSLGRPNFADLADLVQPKHHTKKIVPKITNIFSSETPEPTSKAKILKVKCGANDKLPDKHTPSTSQTSDRPITSDAEKSVVKVNKIIFSNKMKPDDSFVETPKPSVVIRPPVEADRDQPRKKIIIKKPKEIINLDENSQDGSFGFEYRKTKKMIELSSLDKRRENESKHYYEESSRVRENHSWMEDKRRSEARQEERNRRVEKMRMIDEQPAYDLLRYEESIRREREEEQRAKAKKKKKRKPVVNDEYFDEFSSRRNDRRPLERGERIVRRKAEVYTPDYNTPATKRRRGGEVGLSNILESIVETLKSRKEISYLFLKPVTKKEAPDYLDIIHRPMDLSTIRDKVRRLEYKNRDEFRHDVCQIVLNAHEYNDRRNPGIPPLADQLLELCDFLLDQYDESLAEAEAGIE